MQSVEEYNENLNNFLKKNEEKIILISNSIKSNKNIIKKAENNLISNETDTSDLFDDYRYELELLKNYFINPLFSWTMLEKISDFNQWPLGCLGNIIENSLKKEVAAQNIEIDIKFFFKNDYNDGKTCEKSYNEKKKDFTNLVNRNIFQNYFSNTKKNERFFNDVKYEDILKLQNNRNNLVDNLSLEKDKNILNDIEKLTPVLIIKDDGKGIPSLNFIQMIFSFSINEKKEFNFFKCGMKMKTSIIRLCNSFLIISKTDNEINLGLVSKNLQDRFNTDFFITPMINFSYTKNSIIPKSVLYMQTLFFVFEEINFIFSSFEKFIEYIKSFNTGTHIFLYDFKKTFSNDQRKHFFSFEQSDDIFLKNYELFFDLESKDIICTHFENTIPDRSLIDCSFNNYIKFLFLRHNEEINFFVFGNKIPLINPLQSIYNILQKQNNDISKIKHHLRLDEDAKGNAILIDNEIYRGSLFNSDFLKLLRKESTYENIILQSDCILNGILLYSNNRLISRSDQNRLGEVCYFLKKMEKIEKENKKKRKGFNLNGNCINEYDHDLREGNKLNIFSNFSDKEKYENNKEVNLFTVSGFLELPTGKYHVLHNKTVYIKF